MKAVLTYHSIDETGSPISLSSRAFTAHAEWLTSGLVRTLTLDQLLAWPDKGPDAVAVTFDDGYVSARNAVVRLRNSGVPVTVFVVSGLVGGTNAWIEETEETTPTLPLMGWDDLERLAGLGTVIASHTRTHPRLTALSPDQQIEEMQGCCDDLTSKLGIRHAKISYPYGDVDAAVAERAGEIFQHGYTTEPKPVHGRIALLQIPRIDAWYFREPRRLASWGRLELRARLAWERRQARARRARSSPDLAIGAGSS
jgi:peptidoglycan/xylan/chitin deacetylase (PgdA/CDA1 family)